MKKLLILLLLLCSPISAVAADPAIKLVVPFAPGALTDQVARVIQSAINEKHYRPATLVYKAGAGGEIANKFVASSGSDELVLLVHVSDFVFNQALSSPDYNINNIEPLIYIGNAPLVLATSIKSSLASYYDVKQTSKPLTYGSAGVGSTSHFYGELFKSRTKKNWTHIPYKGLGPVAVDLLGGHIDAAFLFAGNAVPYYESKDINVVAAASERRLKNMPQVPTFKELDVPGIDLYAWNILFVNKNKFEKETAELQKIVMDSLKDESKIKQLNEAGVIVTPQKITQEFINKEVIRYKALVKELKITKD